MVRTRQRRSASTIITCWDNKLAKGGDRNHWHQDKEGLYYAWRASHQLQHPEAVPEREEKQPSWKDRPNWSNWSTRQTFKQAKILHSRTLPGLWQRAELEGQTARRRERGINKYICLCVCVFYFVQSTYFLHLSFITLLLFVYAASIRLCPLCFGCANCGSPFITYIIKKKDSTSRC